MDTVIKQTRKWLGQRKQWLTRRVHNLTIRQRIVCASVAGVLLLAAVIPTVQYFIESHRHTLDAATLALVGKANPNLAAKLTYDRQNLQWQFNKDAITDTSSKSNDPAKNIPAALKAQIGGSGQKDESLYAINFPTDPKKGVTFYDAQTQLSFTMTPQFKIHGGKATKDNRIVYPMAGGGQLIYTPKNNGMKEDIVLPKFIGKELSFSYKLDLPSTLSARVQADGSVGVFSIDPSLLGSVSTSSTMDAEKLKSARENAEKNHLLFAIPAPVIAQTGDKKTTATARFGLSGGVLTVTARNMDTVTYPVSVDPSVVVTSSADFQTAGNNDDNVSFDTDQISRAALTGGGITASWNSTSTGTISARNSGGSAAYNGYIYWIGGQDAVGATSEVNYAPVNSNGTIGAWATTTALPAARSYPAAIPYNGKLYVYGGYTSGTTALNTVLYANINTDGTLGSWQTASTTMTTAVCRFGSAAYNGYLYAVGGATGTVTAGCGNASATMTNTLQYAQILANGDIGTWSSSANTYTTARKDVGLAIYNGYAYISSGTTDGTTTYRDTQIAKINDDGTIGTWRTSAEQLPVNGKYRFGYQASGGYLYLSGGTNNMSATLFASIYANGDIGPWQSSAASMATGRYGQGFVVYKGYAYYYGGNGVPAYLSDTGYAKIDTAGEPTAFTTSANTFTTARRGGQTVIYNNYLYVMGGDNGGAPVNTVYYAAINADGTIGTFASTTAFTTARTYFAAVAYNGYMYVIGGCSSAYSSCTTAANNVATIYRAPINAGSGAIGTWINTNNTNLPAARYGIAATIYNNYLYVMGGLNASTFSNIIYYHAVDPGGSTTDGRLSGAWSTSTRTLPASMAYMQAVTYGGRLYVAGGCSAGALTCTTTRNTVDYAGFNTNGELSAALASTNAFTTSRGDFGLAAVNGRLYLTGGRTNTAYYGDAQSAAINTDGTLGSWGTHANTTLASARYGIGVAVANSNIYVTGGYDGSAYYTTVQVTAVNAGGSGAIGSWTEDSTGTLATARTESQTVAYNGYLYVLGGRNTSNTEINSVEYAPINNDGTVGSWQTTNSFTNGRTTFAAATQNDYMYILGGRTANSSAYYKDIQYAKINSDGSLGTWASAGGNVSNGGQGVCMVAHGGYIYSLGGWDGSTDHTSVRYAVQNSNGTIGSWQTAPDFTGARSNIQCLAYGGYLYMSGGEDSTGKNDVQYAAINANGSIGSWALTTRYNLGRANHGMVAYNGYMYVIGGVNSTASNTSRNDAQYAMINPNGTLGPWQHTNSPGGYYYADIATYNGYIYLPAQDDGTLRNTTRFASLTTIARVGHYSKLIDIGAINKITGVTYGGTMAGGTKQISYRTAGEDGVFGSVYNVGRPPSPEGPCIGTYGTGRYIWLSVTLDDTSGINSIITDITTIYESVHPAADIRLHGGKTLQSGALSSLDTCGIYS